MAEFHTITEAHYTCLSAALYEVTSISIAVRTLMTSDEFAVDDGLFNTLLPGLMARTQQLSEAVSELLEDDGGRFAKLHALVYGHQMKPDGTRAARPVDVPFDSLDAGADAFKALLLEIQSGQEAQVKAANSDQHDVNHFWGAKRVEKQLQHSLYAGGPAHREGFVRALTDLLFLWTTGCTVDATEWDPLAATTRAFEMRNPKCEPLPPAPRAKPVKLVQLGTVASRSEMLHHE